MEKGSRHLCTFLSISIVTPGCPVFNSSRPWFNYYSRSTSIHCHSRTVTQMSKRWGGAWLEGGGLGRCGGVGDGLKMPTSLSFSQLQDAICGKCIFHENMTRWHEMAKNISVNNYAKWIRNRIIKHVTELSSPNPRLFPPPATFLCQIIHLIQSKLTLHTNTVLMIYIYRFFMFVFCLLTLWLHSSNLYVYHWSPHSAYSLNQLRFALRLQLTHAYRDQSIHSPQLFLTCSLYGFSTQTHKHTHAAHTFRHRHTHRERGLCRGKGSKLSPSAATSPQDRKSKWTRVICV